ncbi:MAG: hypothetical protein WCK98_01870 [bacterium]
MSKVQDLSLKNTKQEILDAYFTAIQELSQKDSQAIIPSISTAQSLPAKSSTPKTPEELISQFGEIRINLNKILGNLVDELTTQTESLNTVKQNLYQSQNELEESHKIKQTATTLQNLFTIYETKKTELEEDFDKFETTIESRKDTLEKEEQEFKQNLDKQRKREQEEYSYSLKLTRQKDEDEYTKQKEIRENDLKLREQEAIKNQQELTNLRKEAQDFEQKLINAVEKAVAQTKTEVTRDIQTAFDLERKDTEREKQLAELTITNLEKSIATQEAEVIELKKQLVQATAQVKDIAVKVIEVSKKDSVQPMIQTTGANT